MDKELVAVAIITALGVVAIYAAYHIGAALSTISRF